MLRLSNDQCSDAMSQRKEFSNKTGSLHGEWFTDLPWPVGVLPQSYRDELTEMSPVYVVFSYETPIAWATLEDDLLIVPDVRYSLTTGQHQHRCLHVPGEYEWVDGSMRIVTQARKIGRLWNNGTSPDTFSKGRGRTPFRERVGY